MINDLDPSYMQMEITASLTLLIFAFLLWANQDRNKKHQEKIINIFAFLCAGFAVGVFIYGIGYFIYRMVGG